jgi:hypothetical protein
VRLEHPGTSLAIAKRELAASPPAAPAQLAYITARLSDTLAAYSRIADVVGDAEAAAMARLVSARMTGIATQLSAGIGTVTPASRGEYVTGLCDSAVTVLEAREDEMDLAEASAIAVTATETITALRSHVRAGIASGEWQSVSVATSKQLGEVVGMCGLLAAQATHTVVTGGGLGRRRPPRSLDAPSSRAIAHDAPTPGEQGGPSR